MVDGIDQATADLIAQLQREDAESYFETRKGKSRDPTDEELAFQLLNEELGSVSQFLGDKRMAMSMAAAVQVDGQAIADTEMEERAATRDRNVARDWTEDGRRSAPDDPQAQPDSTFLDDETLDKLMILHMLGVSSYHGVEDMESGRAESSAWAAQRRGQSPAAMHSCVACNEATEFVNVARAPCRHEYCRSCLNDLFETSMTDESLFPPRCCRQPIAINIARIFLKPGLAKEYEKKKIEFDTPNRTYCYAPECSAFIHPSLINDTVATCPKCAFTTCTQCKGRAHIGDCPNDSAMQQLLDTAVQNGWQRCYSCWRMVELDHGCNHMTCRCGAQFCYNCGEKWKGCQCEQWNEHRLLARAYQILDRDANPPVPQAPEGPADPLPDAQRLIEPAEPQPTNAEEFNIEEFNALVNALVSAEEVNAEEVNAEEVNAEEVNAKEVNPEEVNAEEVNPEEVNPEEVNAQEANTVEVNSAEVNATEVNAEEVTAEDATAEEANIASFMTDRDILVQRMMQELRENHACDHLGWKYVHGPNRENRIEDTPVSDGDNRASDYDDMSPLEDTPTATPYTSP
ncbi:hypothetical protein BJX76DRAFT_353991 [Aspergillus varians]